MGILIGQEIANTGPKRTQVWLATHTGGGERLPLMARSFISFYYDGKWSEDMGVLSVIDGDRMSRPIYGEFEDTTSELKAADGQLYWSTYFTNHTLSFTLATDRITEQELDNIKHWLKPGPARELILAENPNRAIMARISDTPEYNLLPFEEKITKKIAGREYETSTTVYRGDISVTFTMDKPFWYAKCNILDYHRTDGTYQTGYWMNISRNKGQEIVPILTDRDALKVIAEDGTPTFAMMSKSEDMFYGVKLLFNTTDNSDELPIVGKALVGHAILGKLMEQIVQEGGYDFYGGTNNKKYFYYPGTAPSAPTIEFTLTPTIDGGDGGSNYLIMPNNTYASGTTVPFNTITIEGHQKQILKFTTCSVYTAYNQAIAILKQAVQTQASEAEVRKLLRDNVNHHAVRSWAVHCYDTAKASGDAGWGARAYNMLYQFFKLGTPNDQTISQNVVTENADTQYNREIHIHPFLAEIEGDPNMALTPAHFSINGETGECIGEFYYQTCVQDENTKEYYYTAQYHKEEVGDMIISNYFTINERNFPTDEGYIGTFEQSPTYSHCIYHDWGYHQNGVFMPSPLRNFILLYKNYYY